MRARHASAVLCTTSIPSQLDVFSYICRYRGWFYVLIRLCQSFVFLQLLQTILSSSEENAQVDLWNCHGFADEDSNTEELSNQNLNITWNYQET